MTASRDIADLLISAATISLRQQAPILEAVEAIDRTDARIALVTDGKGALIGSVTDGDIRRGLLKGATLDSPVETVMHKNPHSLPATTPIPQILSAMQDLGIKQLPLVNASGAIAGVAVYDLLAGLLHAPRSNAVVIMAGGKGQRLMPLTSDRPKPMVEVGGKPILEWIVQRFVQQGFRQFYFAINYMGQVIEDHFKDGERFGCQIRYLKEPDFMGTAGALSLLGETFREPLIVINGDILASVDFSALLDYHIESKSMATVAARPHRMEVPYGVIQLKDGTLETIVEKPVYEDLVSAGIYAINPAVLSYVPKNGATDMPGVLLKLVQESQKVAVFPMREDWIDVGRHDDLERAKNNVG